MIKSNQLDFHETFQPETDYISGITRLASEEFCGTKFEISEMSGIPTGKQKGKVEPHIKYAKFMGLIDFGYENGIYSLKLTETGEEVIREDPYLHEELSRLICHYGITRREVGAPQWEFLIHNAHPGFETTISQERLYSLATTWCDVTPDNMSKKVFTVVKASYNKGIFAKTGLIDWKKELRFNVRSFHPELIFVYAYALSDSWDRTFKGKREITEPELRGELGLDRIFGFDEDGFCTMIDSLAFEGVITLNRQLFPATIIRTSDTESIVKRLYSRLL